MKNKIYSIVAFTLLSFSTHSQVINKSFMFDNLNRSYIVYLPSTYTPGASLPMVFILHGYTSNANSQMAYSQFNVEAEANNFIAVYPEGVNNAWNAGAGFASNANDIGFLNALIDTLHADYNINLDRVYSCGMSNGGFMSYRLACELSHRITAIASVTGSMTTGQHNGCAPSRTVPVMQIHGTSDATVPYAGSLGIVGIDNVMQFWANHNSCPTTANITPLPDVSATDNCTVERHDFLPCANTTETVLLKVIDGGHTWPGAVHIPSLGNTNQDIDATEEIWIFFSQFTLSGTTKVAENLFDNLQVYPNPADEILHISGLEAGRMYEVKLYTIAGKAVLEKSLNAASEIIISVEELPSGMYLLELQQGHDSVKQKILIR